MTAAETCLCALAGAAACALMEPWAALLHRALWHGPWWAVHRSHHNGRGDVAAAPGAGRPAGLEANDLLSLMHAPPAAWMVFWGLAAPPSPWAALSLGVGGGMSLFGLAYILVHDGLVHRRLPVARLARMRYFRRILAAHTLHHRTGGPPFGLFAAPWHLGPGRAARAPARRQPALGHAKGPMRPGPTHPGGAERLR